MATNYKVKFNNYQLNVFRTLELNGNKLYNLQSVYSYLIKYSENGLVSKSLSRLYKMYNYYRKSFCKSYFYELVNELVDLNLLEKNGRKVIIIYNQNEKVDKKVDKKVDEKKQPKTTENTILKDILSNAQLLTSYSYTNTYTNNTQINYGKGNKYIATKKDSIATKEELLEIALELLKNLKIKSKIIKNNVLNKIDKYAGTIYNNGAISYINKIINEFIIKNQIKRENYFLNKIYVSNMVNSDMRSAKNKKFCEMMTRDRSENNKEGNMSWNEIENALLYHEID